MPLIKEANLPIKKNVSYLDCLKNRSVLLTSAKPTVESFIGKNPIESNSCNSIVPESVPIAGPIEGKPSRAQALLERVQN